MRQNVASIILVLLLVTLYKFTIRNKCVY